MTMHEKYKEIFSDEISKPSKVIIFQYSVVENKYSFQPFSHAIAPDAVEKLSSLMRDNLYFYCYGEEEIVKHYESKSFVNLETAVKFACKNRTPKRLAKMDGLPGEVLLDLLVQLYVPSAFKVAVRPLLRQNDNNEIKGYDLAYFSMEDGLVSLWLGQAKLGDKSYCKSDIKKDLISKFTQEYLANQVFFVAEKSLGTTAEAQKLANIINEVNIATLEEDETKRAKELTDCFYRNNISIVIPCLLAYGEEGVYKSASDIIQKIDDETNDIQTYFLRDEYIFNGIMPKINFYIFPIEDIEKLRSEDRGFYNGLR